jgi:hypothetical protein
MTGTTARFGDGIGSARSGLAGRALPSSHADIVGEDGETSL